MNLVFLGPPGSGKGTQGQAIVEHFGLGENLSTGDIIRGALKSETSEVGAQARAYFDANGKGALLPDQLVNGMVAERITQPVAKKGFLLDGYPRTIAQADALDEMLAADHRRLDHVVLLEVPDELLVERITGRRNDPETGRIYHLKYDPPASDILGRLVQRPDDTEEVLRDRLEEYHAKTQPLVPRYESTGILRRVDGQGAMDVIRDRIFAALKGLAG